ncbi:putative acid phosphatase [Rosellinia necatrix]|uniref:Purple acid phosphatase n=1 Tax=Rosellinia necatrix TaxID=77044 RepID=A0A1W2TN67_ROSNE|nr:putative acid phosphatase [Rosellinia necatrix]
MKPSTATTTPLIWASALAVGVAAGANYPAIPVDRTTPTQQRIAIKGPNSVAIGWNTYAQLSKPCVDYGPSASDLSSTACSATASATYPHSRTWGNSVVLSGLRAGASYWYRPVTSNASVAASRFRAPRPAGSRDPFAFAAVVDLGVYGRDGYTIAHDGRRRDAIPGVEPALNHTTIGRLAASADDYDFVVHPGDLAYADDWLLRPLNLFDGVDAYDAILEQFYGQLEPISARKPYMVGPGNHEANCQEIPYTQFLCVAGQKNFTDFAHRFGDLMPTAFPSRSSNASARALAARAASLARPPFWYSFEYGQLHLVMIDTETDFADAPDQPGGSAGLNSGPFFTGASGLGRDQQLAFLEADLASVDRAVTPWVVVAGHRPWYTTGGASDGCAPCRDAFEPLLYRYGVDLAVFGHVHNAQRFAPVGPGSVPDPAGLRDPRAPLYVVAGGAGNIEGLTPVGTRQDFNEFAYADDFSYARVELRDRHRLRLQFLRSTTGEVLDEAELFKTHAERFVVQ